MKLICPLAAGAAVLLFCVGTTCQNVTSPQVPLGDAVPQTAFDPDSDGDGLTDSEERALMTDPYRADTDGDCIYDADDPLPLGQLTQVSAVYCSRRYLAIEDGSMYTGPRLFLAWEAGDIIGVTEDDCAGGVTIWNVTRQQVVYCYCFGRGAAEGTITSITTRFVPFVQGTSSGQLFYNIETTIGTYRTYDLCCPPSTSNPVGPYSDDGSGWAVGDRLLVVQDTLLPTVFFLVNLGECWRPYYAVEVDRL